jgi:hypothetical protein
VREWRAARAATLGRKMTRIRTQISVHWNNFLPLPEDR